MRPSFSLVRRLSPSWFALSIALCCHASSASAASILLRGGVVHPVSGPTLASGSVFLRDGRISAVGVEISGSADQVIELNGRHVYPGLLAPTTVLGLLEIDGVRATRDTTEPGEFHPDVASWTAVNPDSELIPVARANGFGHVETIPLGGWVSGHSAVIALAGWTAEDLAVRRSAALHVFWPSFALDVAPRDRGASKDRGKGLDEQIKDRDRRLKEIDDFFSEAEAYAKAKAVGGAAFKSVPAWEAMVPVVRRELPVAVHADEYRQIQSAVEWLARRKYSGWIAGGRDAWRLPGLLATNRIGVAFEHVFTLPTRDSDSYDVHFTAPSVLARAGVAVSFSEGTDQFGASNIRNIPYAAAQAVAFGLAPDEALRGLTLYPAQLLGVADRLGTLEPGKEATLFVADGDILDLRTHVQRMWIAGREASLESRHTRLFERYRNRPRTQP